PAAGDDRLALGIVACGTAHLRADVHDVPPGDTPFCSLWRDVERPPTNTRLPATLAPVTACRYRDRSCGPRRCRRLLRPCRPTALWRRRDCRGSWRPSG